MKNALNSAPISANFGGMALSGQHQKVSGIALPFQTSRTGLVVIKEKQDEYDA